jgi:hypothetical protein
MNALLGRVPALSYRRRVATKKRAAADSKVHAAVVRKLRKNRREAMLKLQGGPSDRQLARAGLTQIRPIHYESEELRSRVGSLATLYLMQWRATHDDHAEQMRILLLALADTNLPPQLLARLAGKARHWLEANNRGPGTRVHEANFFAKTCARAASSSDHVTDAAAELVRKLRSMPWLARGTRVPSATVRWPDPDHAQAIVDVASALQREGRADDGERIAIAVLHALGMSRKDAHNAYAHRDAALRRKSKTPKI